MQMNLPVPQHGSRVGTAVQQLINLILEMLSVILGWQLDSVANIAALATVEDTRIPDGSSKVVRTLWDSFTLDKNSTAVVDGITVVATMSGTGRWLRNLTPNPVWSSQATWYVDAVNGNDENNGATDSTELKTFSEFRRRVEANGVYVNMTVYIETDLPATDLVGLYCGGDEVTIEGVPTTAYTGTVNTFSKVAASNQIGTLNDAVWTVADHLYKFILFTDGAAAGYGCWVLEDLGGGDARVSEIVEDVYGYAGTSTPGGGDSFVVQTLPIVTFDNPFLYTGNLRVGKLQQRDWGTSSTRIALSCSILSTRSCNLTMNCTAMYGLHNNIMANIAVTGSVNYLYGGAFGLLYNAAYGEGIVTYQDVVVHQAVPSAIGVGVFNAGLIKMNDDLYLYGAFGSYAMTLNEHSILELNANRVRGITTATRLARVYDGVTIGTTQTDHSVTEKTVRIDPLALDIEFDTQQPFFDPHYKVVVGSAPGAGSGAIGPINSGVKGALNTADGTRYALGDYTESATNVIPMVATNRCMLRNLRAHLGTAIGGTDQIIVNVLVDKGAGFVATGITLTLLAATEDEADITHAYLVDPGDLIAFQLVRSGGATGAGSDLSLSLEAA
jgi:hypothetical protein